MREFTKIYRKKKDGRAKRRTSGLPCLHYIDGRILLCKKSNSSHLQIVMILDRSVLTLLNNFFFAMKFIDLIDFIQLLLNQRITLSNYMIRTNYMYNKKVSSFSLYIKEYARNTLYII